MPDLPTTINGVTLEFGAGVNKSVNQRIIDGLKHCIKPDIASGHALTVIYISSASDQHSMPSRHAQSRAVDISRVNGTKIVIGYASDDHVKAIVDAIQTAFESYAHRRENYGPLFKKKSGVPHAVSGHQDHIHLSVN